MEIGQDSLVEKAICAAVYAGAYRLLMRQHPESRGLEVMAQRHSDQATRLVSAICARPVEGPAGSQPL